MMCNTQKTMNTIGAIQLAIPRAPIVFVTSSTMAVIEMLTGTISRSGNRASQHLNMVNAYFRPIDALQTVDKKTTNFW